MKSRKIFILNIITIIITVICMLYAFTSNAAEPETSAFMDMDSAIRALQTKVSSVSPGIVSVVSYDNTGAETGRKSGIFTDRSGVVITNADFLKDAYSAAVFTESGRFDKVTILNQDDNSDLALLKINSTDTPALEMDLNFRLKPEERVIIIGKSDDFKRTVTEGLISNVYDLNELSNVFDIKTTLPISLLPKSTDGAVFNMAGNVIGIIFNKPVDQIEKNIFKWMSDDKELSAVSVNHVKILLERDSIETRLHHAKARVWHLWLIKELKTASINGVLFLYQSDIKKTLISVVLIFLVILLIQYSYQKIRKS